MNVRSASVLVLAVAFVSSAATADDSRLLRPLYPYGIFPGLLTNPKVKAELKVTKGQEPEIEKSLKKWRAGFVKHTEPGKALDFRALQALEKANFDGMCELLARTLSPEQMRRMKQIILQESGMELFDHREIRDALNLKPDQVKRLKAIHGQLLKEISGGGGGKYSKEEVGRRFGALMKGVPDRVRAALSEGQRKRLQELIGDQFAP
jgi:hypothetical protein